MKKIVRKRDCRDLMFLGFASLVCSFLSSVCIEMLGHIGLIINGAFILVALGCFHTVYKALYIAYLNNLRANNVVIKEYDENNVINFNRAFTETLNREAEREFWRGNKA